MRVNSPPFQNWWDADPQDCNIEKYFNPAHPYNIGACPEPPLVFVDLDSKPDRGKSVREFIASRPELQNVPRHASRGGEHLVFVCEDLPVFLNEHGNRYLTPLRAQLSETVSAELFHSSHSNIVLPVSQHPVRDSANEPHFVYTWTRTGVIPKVTWQWLQDTFGFKAPEYRYRAKDQPKKKSSCHQQFRGDLTSLDVVRLLEELGHPPTLLQADTAMYGLLCPWHQEHTEDNGRPTGSSTVIWQPNNGQWPSFDCKHAHCAGRKLQELLEWAEHQEPGIVDRFCARERVWSPGQQSVDGKPRILHPHGRPETTVYREIGQVVGPAQCWFNRGDEIVTVQLVPSGFFYSENESTKYNVASYTVGLRELNAIRAKSSLEKYIEPGVLAKDKTGEQEFVPKSFSTDFCAGLIESEQLKEQLGLIARILTVPLPFRLGNKLVYPKAGYDPRFATFLLPNAPAIQPLPLNDALKVIDKLYQDFCFTNEQSRTHAIARLITPFARAILGWTTRVPLWFYCANRPRAGKDYLSGITLIVYEGHAFEDLPIGRESEETGKRIMAAARSGRRFMHFSNCQRYLEDQYLTQAVTNPTINGRRLGSNDASSDLSVPNEIEFSLSANVGLTYREDFEPRMRKIELAYYEEHPNARVFRDKFLHRTVLENRALILSAIAALYDNWKQKAFPEGQTDFISYPDWASIVGGVMTAAGLGDPCRVFEGEFNTGGDLKTATMTELFRVCFEAFADAWVVKKQIYHRIHEATLAEKDTDGNDTAKKEAEGNDILRWFGPLEGTEDARKNQTALGILLHQFKNRILDGVQLLIDESSNRSIRHRYRFKRLYKSRSEGVSGPYSGQMPHPNPETPPESGHLGHLGHLKRLADVCARGKNVSLPSIQGGKDKKSIFSLVNEPLSVSKVSEVSTLTADSLALDLETFAEVRVSKANRAASKPVKIRPTGEALSPWKGQIRLLTLADSADNIQSFDLRQGPLPPEIQAAITSQELIIHHAAFDLRFLAHKLGLWPGRVFCTLTASYLLDPLRSVRHSLGAVLERYLAVTLPKEHGSSDWGAFVLTDAQLEYARDDVRYLHRLRDVLTQALAAAGQSQMFALEMALLAIITRMELHGFALDTDLIRSMLVEQKARAAQLHKEIRNAFLAPALNPNAPEQLQTAFGGIGVSLENTEEETLCAIADPRAQLVLDYRGVEKLVGTLESLLENQREGRIYAQFNPLGAVSGRFSSRHPNLQQIQRGPVRAVFVASGADRVLIVADYSQIELRIAALVAGEAVMINALKEGIDLHSKIAAVSLRIDLRKVTKEQRNIGKTINFGFLYGRSAEGYRRGVRKDYGLILTSAEARAYRNAFFTIYPAIAAWHQDCQRKAKDPNNNQTRTIFGRRLVAQRDDPWARFNLWTNYVVQGACADLLKAAMVKIASILPSDCHLVATVHDELIYDAPAAPAEEYRGMISLVMEEVFSEIFGTAVPIVAEAKVCTNWAQK
jgi:DNA polymerase I-like protein with 3'-5' exonuclease and polymerase domains